MKLRRFISIGMIVTLLFASAFHTVLAAPEKEEDKLLTEINQTSIGESKKSEVVYGTLSASGSVNALYVVNHFEVSKAGLITDYGQYNSVQNLTNLEAISHENDSITFQADSNDFYYQGNMDATNLPWLFDISYEMDGVTLSGEEIAGKTGKLGIHIKSSPNDEINSTFYENYMLQITITLYTEKCSNINATDAIVADAGNNKKLVFTVMQNKNANYYVTADVNEFTMSGIEITAMPFSMNMDLPDTDGMLNDIDKLPEAITKLNDGVGKLADGTFELKEGTDELKNGSGDIRKGLSELKKNSSSIVGASSQINNALKEISTSLSNGSNGADLSQFAKLPTALKELSQGLKSISKGLTDLKNGYKTAYTALDSAIQCIPDVVITQEQIASDFANVDGKQQKILNDLYSSYVAGQTVKATYNQVNLAFASVVPTIDTLSGSIDTISLSLDQIASGLGDPESGTDITAQLGQLSKGLTVLSNNYTAFDKGLNEYLNGVGKMSDGYNQFDSGLTEFKNGVGTLNNGVSELYNGTEKLNDEISKMPDKIQEEIDKLKGEYVGSDYQPISYTSIKNTNTELVQFVLKCDGIKVPEEAKDMEQSATKEASKKEETVLGRLIALFK